MNQPSDDQLLVAAQAGDRPALEQLLERLQGKVYGFGLRMCRNPEDAQDVLQDTLLAMARGVREFRRESSVATWLYSIARSYCLKKRRKSKFAPPSHLSLNDDTTPGMDNLIDTGPPPDDAAASRQVERALQRAIDQLDPAYREVLLLRDVEGLTAPEVAEVVGISIDAVKSRLHRARRAVRDQVAPLLPVAASAPATASTCPDVLQLFSQRLEDDISPQACDEMQQHLEACARCRGACASLRETLALCSAATATPIPGAVEQQVRKAVQKFLTEEHP
ncbi:MAG TPA: sigma-70 family RNA polymerase sigma factor [Polyangiaceae bacterium]|nr:sigma-70 family RNA polymerase sigma factor [Polyangiaceae bacterium]